jgi:hypothetical protein
MTRRILLLALSASVACSAKEGTTDSANGTSTPAAATPAASSSSGNQDLADISTYKLTMDGIDKFYAAQRNLGLKMKAMSPAEREAAKARGDESTSDLNSSLDDMVVKIDKEPVYAAAVREAGLSTREYVLVMMSMMQSSMAAGVIKMRPKDNADSLAREMKANPENVRFIQQHEAELAKKQTEMAAEMKKLGIDDSE